MTRLFALAAVAALGAPALADGPPIAVVSGGIVSADQKTVFLPSKEGGIEAVELATGKLLWSTKGAGRLAGASDKAVVAWAADAKKLNAFRVTALDAATGKVIGTSDPIPMPEWARVQSGDGFHFRAAAKVEDGAAVVAWEAGAYYAGGARPTPEIEAAARRSEGGLANVDFATGKVTPANGKPKEDAFQPVATKVGEYEFRLTEQGPELKPGAVQRTKVTLTVVRDKKELWKRELAGNPWFLPRP
jgi:outer membrane protein assembly factor BamB